MIVSFAGFFIALPMRCTTSSAPRIPAVLTHQRQRRNHRDVQHIARYRHRPVLLRLIRQLAENIAHRIADKLAQTGDEAYRRRRCAQQRKIHALMLDAPSCVMSENRLTTPKRIINSIACESFFFFSFFIVHTVLHYCRHLGKICLALRLAAPAQHIQHPRELLALRVRKRLRQPLVNAVSICALGFSATPPSPWRTAGGCARRRGFRGAQDIPWPQDSPSAARRPIQPVILHAGLRDAGVLAHGVQHVEIRPRRCPSARIVRTVNCSPRVRSSLFSALSRPFPPPLSSRPMQGAKRCSIN